MADLSDISMPLKATGTGDLSTTSISLKKRTILDYDADSYLEEDDATYAYDETVSAVSSDEDFSEDISVEENDILIENKEDLVEIQVNSMSNGANPSKFRQFLMKHEIPRKVLHSSIGVFTLWLYTLGVNHRSLIFPLSVLFSVIFINDYLRLHNDEFNKKVLKNWWFIIREKEKNTYNGTLYFLAGLILVFVAVPKDIAVMSVLLLSWADTAASTFGRQFGKYTPKLQSGKSLAGSIASFVVGVLATYILYAYFIPNYAVNSEDDILWTPESSRLSLFTYAISSGLIASLSELIDIWGLDDNFTIPVLSGFFLFIFASLFKL